MADDQPRQVRGLLGRAGISTTLDAHNHVVRGIGDGLAYAMDGES